jgi:hypothetical protein
MRWMRLVLIALVVFTSGCRSRGERGEHDGVNLGQNVTVNSKPVDPVFKDFPKTWRQFISSSPELALAVIPPEKREPAPPEAITFSECVFSPDAGGYVPQVTISWNEMSGQVIEARASSAQRTQTEEQVRRFDLGLHHDPFTRNFYSSIFSGDRLKRFSLPSNSALVNNPEAVLLTGPGLFPKLMDYRAELLQDPATNRQFTKQTVVVRELSEGISNTMRVSHLVGKEWTTEQEFIFLAPVCPVSF